MSDELAALTLRAHGKLATLRRAHGPTRQVHGVYRDRIEPAEAGGRSIASREVSLTLATLDAEGLLPGDVVDVAGGTWRVRSLTGDGTAQTLALEAVA